MKLYVLLALTALYVFASVGFVLPFLMSAASDVMVIVGIGYMISMPIVVYLLYNMIKKVMVKETEIENS